VTKAYHLPPGKPIRAGVKVWLGLWALPVGPASVCNEPSANCSSLAIKDGIAYAWLNKLVYGVDYSVCPGRLADPGPLLRGVGLHRREHRQGPRRDSPASRRHLSVVSSTSA